MWRSFCYTTCCWVRWTQISSQKSSIMMSQEWLSNICLYLPLILSNSVTRHVDKFDKLRFQPEFICNAYVKMFCKIVFIFIADFLKWCQTRCCWVRWIQISARNHLWCCMWRIFANIYLYLPLIFSNGVTRHVVEYDKFRFQL